MPKFKPHVYATVRVGLPAIEAETPREVLDAIDWIFPDYVEVDTDGAIIQSTRLDIDSETITYNRRDLLTNGSDVLLLVAHRKYDAHLYVNGKSVGPLSDGYAVRSLVCNTLEATGQTYQWLDSLQFDEKMEWPEIDQKILDYLQQRG